MRGLMLGGLCFAALVSVVEEADAEGLSVVSSVPTIQVSGEYALQVAPDIAYVDIIIYAKDLQHLEAKNKADKLLKEAKRVAASLDIHEKNLKTTYVSINPAYEYVNNQQKLAGYEATYSLHVTVEKLSDVAVVIDKFVKAGIDRVGGVQYAIKNDEAAKLMAMSKAVENAKLKAKTLADAANVGLGAVISINENGANSSPPIHMARNMVASDAMMEKSAGGEAPPQGEIAVSANVNMVFEIKQISK